MAANNEKIHWDLDLAEAERADEIKDREPFRAKVGDRVIEMVDAADLDWKVLLEIEHPVQFLRHAIKPDDQDYLRKKKIGGAVFNTLIESYMRHYGLGKSQGDAGSRTF